MAINYGMDYTIFSGTPPDLDLSFSEITDPGQVLLEDAYKKLTTPSGIEDPPTGQFWDTNTIDLREYFLSSMSPAQVADLTVRIRSVFDTELRYDITPTVTFSQGVLTVLIDLIPSSDLRPLRMVFTITSTSISFERVA